LTLLRGLREYLHTIRQKFLIELRDRRISRALRTAQYFHSLYPGKESAQMLAVCHLLKSDFRSAIGALRHARLEERPAQPSSAPTGPANPRADCGSEIFVSRD
jgi:hypothetical protein